MPARPIDALALTCVLGSTVLACQPAAREPEPPAAGEVVPEVAVVDVVTDEYTFSAPAELPSGWTTLRLRNEGAEPHFLVLWLLPEGRTFDDYVREVVEPFADLVPRYRAGEMERAELLEELGGRLPGWLRLAEMGMGGVGFTSPGRTAETTIELVPGSYVMECYMVSADGKLHSREGMLRPLVVTGDDSGGSPPEADVELTLSNYQIASAGELTPGEHTVSVLVAEQPEGLLGHDVHLARLDEDTALEDVVAWMDWADGLQPPAPARFLGGAEQVPAGRTSYLTVELEPGRYAWISEGYGAQGMVLEFRVGAGG
jgi:hypothetical protein